MATYNPQTWANNPATTSPLSAARLTAMETGIAGAYTSPRPVFLQVVSASAPAWIRDGADASGSTGVYLCDGTDDQVQINAALTAAFNANGGGPGEVFLNGLYNISSPVLMQALTMLTGTGLNTVIRSVGMGAVGMIQLAGPNHHMTQVRDLTLWGNATSGGASHGVYYINSDAGGDGNTGTYYPGNSPDASHRFDNVFIKNFTGGTRHGFFMDDNVRDCNVHRMRINSCSGNGLYLNGASDGKFSQVIIAGCNIGFNVGGGSNQFIQCKTAYMDTDGWVVSSSRAHITGCHAQDSGRWGFYVTGATPTMASCVADSNSRLDQTGGGFYLNAAGCYEGLDAYDRNQTPGSRQNRGMSFGASMANSYVTGKSDVPTGANQVVGTAPAFARIVRPGTTIYSAG